MTPKQTKYDFLITSPGTPLPLGSNIFNNGIQFSIFSRHARAVSLILFHSNDTDSDFTEIVLDKNLNKTGDIWHIWIDRLKKGQVYGYKIDGEYRPEEGHRYNFNKLLLDPYSRAITGNFKWDLDKARGVILNSEHEALSWNGEDSTYHVPRSIVIEGIDNSEKSFLKIPENELIIYELHLKGFTAHGSSGISNPGTYMGLTEKIPYLKKLGVNAVELLPIQEFDEYENIMVNPVTGEKLKNFWGYSTISFFAPKGSYACSGNTGEQVREFREMVKKFHEAEIEVILDVVFNHTHEGDYRGPTLSFRGIDNSIYYMLEENNIEYKNYSGCGNTFNCNHPLVRQFIVDCLRYWVIEMDVDGFRFDLASILGRDQDGEMLNNPPLIEWIEEDPILRNRKIIAEAWDAGGAYQVGKFPGRWSEWNGRYRDDIRRFWRGDEGFKGPFATRLTGSSDLYFSSTPTRSINFITCHDGFTLNDLVSYNEKHNIENGELNRDGENHNFSYNWGTEGPTDDKSIDTLRVRNIKNFISTLFLSLGIPMLLAGDEFRRTQNGNNNSYCQDNDISWVNWNLLEENSEILEFTQRIISFRKKHQIFRRENFFTGKTERGYRGPDIKWFNERLNEPKWDSPDNTLAVYLNGEYSPDSMGNRDRDIYMAFNATSKNVTFKLPMPFSGFKWELIIDTSRGSGSDILEEGKGIIINGDSVKVNNNSMIVLLA